MRILHINSYYFTNEIHKNFRLQLSKTREDDVYFIPTYKKSSKRFNDVEVTEAEIYRGYDKVIFFSKSLKSLLFLRRLKLVKSLGLIHAHTLISDGLIAYILNKIYKIQYIITVRNTDLNFFLKNSLFRAIGKRIIANASAIICLSPSYSEKIRSIYPFLGAGDKLKTLPNGIDDYWLKNKFNDRETCLPNETVRLLFVGRVDKNKNVSLIIKLLQRSYKKKIHLSVVGENCLALDFGKVQESLSNGNSIEYCGVVINKAQLRDLYRQSHIFCMISHKESFGVSYLEALSQGLPILYTRNEGIDGCFEEGLVGKACSPNSVESLEEGVDFAITNYAQLVRNSLTEIDKFSWERIAAVYFTILKWH